jgi:hypothetical protein
MKSKLVSHFSGTHCVWKILFVSENQQNSVTQFVIVQQSVQIIPSSITEQFTQDKSQAGTTFGR